MLGPGTVTALREMALTFPVGSFERRICERAANSAERKLAEGPDPMEFNFSDEPTEVILKCVKKPNPDR